MSIAVFIDTPAAKHDLAIELAVALGEYCLEENEPLYLLADAVTALEVGISLIGSRESRTVESGEYRVSPIQLLPFIPRPNSKDDEVLRGTSELSSGGEISELFELGLFARKGERADEIEFGDEPAQALSQVISAARPKCIIGMGMDSTFWISIGSGIESSPDYWPRLMMIEGLGNTNILSKFEQTIVIRPEISSVRRRELDALLETVELEELRLQAERDGALVAAFLQELTRKDSRDDGTTFRALTR